MPTGSWQAGAALPSAATRGQGGPKPPAKTRNPPPSFRRRPESSGVISHSCKAGMTLKGGIGSVWHRRIKTGSLLTPRPALLDSSLRWNDNEEKKGGLPSDNPFAIVDEYLTPVPRHSGVGRNPVVYAIHARNAGMASEEYPPPKTPTQSQAAPAPPMPPHCHNPPPHPR